MGKENETESTKKRRKSVTTGVTTPVKDADMYKVITTYEEKEAMDRSPATDSENFLSMCENIRTLMDKIAKLKVNSEDSAKEEIRELQIQTSLAFIELKKLNRMEKFRTKFARDSLVAAKSSVDSRHLHLQNLLYEVMHLKKEVVKCLQFKSKDESIELVPEDEFYKEAPESVSRPEITKNDPHQLRLARLEWELMQRKQLAALCDELTDSKKGVAASIESKQTRLDNLAPQLRTILEASKPLQESLGLPLDKIRQEHQKAALLASPLYVLYAKATAYRDAYDSSLLVSIEGDDDDAKRVNSQEGSQDSDSDQDNQTDGVVEETPVHKKRHHRMSKEARLEEKKLRLLQRHPLSVRLVMVFKSNTKLTLNFFYMSYLNVVTLDATLDTENPGGVSAGDMLVSDSVLRELFPGDLGLESPNPANHYQLCRYGLGPFPSLQLGIPYNWAQRMAGLRFITSDNAKQMVAVNHGLAQDSVECVLKEIKRRVKARLELCSEIRQLESGNLSIFTDSSDPMPCKIATVLHKFNTLSWKSYSSFDNTPPFYQKGLVSPMDIFYEAVLRRESSELVAHIAIKPDYPRVPPIFSITLNPTVPASVDILRDIEREVNVMWEKPPTLSAQLQRLRACFDIYLETEGIVPQEKIFFHPVRGRTRARPYKYLTLGGGIFTHR
ncbi:THO complex subunit 5 homolog [Neodiprion pinetum]|uniref:THO complex subunit 5 homolog n=1 Tax=Neodiprion lecontei TaxID=441921 RepID=A0A6J0CBH8_NEOLC|nr:THO complex subunit 5 homolog [Neodiprion lecontei]XP_046484738.1 THO complex subunit 5 homolog [Neodiprion pinetum]